MTRDSQPPNFQFPISNFQPQIRPPREKEWPAVCEMLARIWPVEKWLWDGSSTGAIKLYRWRTLCAYIGSEIAGSISRTDITLWLNGKQQTIAGIASVATAPAHRRKGIAKRLLTEILKTVDADQLPAALFTDLPAVYQPHGFQTVPQEYVTINTDQLPTQTSSLTPQQYDTLGPEQIASLARIYQHHYPNHHGKIVRDPDYWTWYTHHFNHNPNARITIYHTNQKIKGYTRTHHHPTQPILAEYCCPPNDSATISAMLSDLRAHKEILLALPPEHPIHPHFRPFILQPSSLSPSLEHLMLRPSILQPSVLSLTWSLADKF